jgi:hypothetical protein
MEQRVNSKTSRKPLLYNGQLDDCGNTRKFPPFATWMIASKRFSFVPCPNSAPIEAGHKAFRPRKKQILKLWV